MSDEFPPGEEDLPAAPEPEATAAPEFPPEPPAPAEPPAWAARGGRASLRRLDRLVLLAIVALSAVLHLARLATPGATLPTSDDLCKKSAPISGPCHDMIPLDEVHYVPDARDVIRYGTESDDRIGSDDGAYVVHPPVGKWFIAAGIKLFGDGPFGWRFFGALLGTLGTAVIYFLALRLWRSPWWAAMAAFLLSVEGLWFVQSRVAMLDIYAAFFVLTGMWFLLEDRDRAPGARRWWLLGAGLAFGFAIGSKWSTAPFIAIAGGLALAWEIGRPLDPGVRRIRPLGATAGALTLIPLVVYVASFTGWFVDDHRYSPPLCEGRSGVVSKWLCYQREVAGFHEHLAKFEKETKDGKSVTRPAHPYFGEAWSWPWIGRPVAHYYVTFGKGAAERAQEVLGLPNPAIWWLAFGELPLLAFFVLRRRDPVAPLLFAFFVAGFVPYLFADAVGRPVFLFYATPMIPFMVLTVVHCFVRLVHRFPRANLVPIGFCVITAASFAYFYPVIAAWPVSTSGPLGWRARMWLGSDCTIENKIKILCWI